MLFQDTVDMEADMEVMEVMEEEAMEEDMAVMGVRYLWIQMTIYKTIKTIFFKTFQQDMEAAVMGKKLNVLQCFITIQRAFLLAVVIITDIIIITMDVKNVNFTHT